MPSCYVPRLWRDQLQRVRPLEQDSAVVGTNEGRELGHCGTDGNSGGAREDRA
jgi:hypothetical protein